MNKVNLKNKGSIPILTLVLMPVLLVSVGLALDMGKFFVVKSELQNAADACALAAAYELDGLTAISFTNAEAAGVELARQNTVLFQKNTVATPTVEFSSTIDGSYVSAGSATPATDVYVRCTVSEANIPNWFLQLLPSFGEQTINAQAVASNLPGQQTCAMPIGVCETDLLGKSPGDWVGGIVSANDKNVQGVKTESLDAGFFKWMDFSNPAGGASELAALLSGATSCEVSAISPTIGEMGSNASVRAHYNTRFGIYAKNSNLEGAVPDYTGYAYNPKSWTPGSNAYSDYIKQVGANTPYQNLPDIKFAGKPYVLTNRTDLATRGQSRRLAVAPVIDCGTQKLKGWACIFLLHPMETVGNDFEMYLEYLGDASAGGPCKTFDLAGGPATNGPRVSSLVQ